MPPNPSSEAKKRPPSAAKQSAVRAAAARERLAAKKARARGPGKVPTASPADRVARAAKRRHVVRVSAASASPALDLARASDSVRESSSATLVLVHSPMCGHCLHMRPAFDSASKALLSRGVQVVEIESSAMSGPSSSNNPLVIALSDGYVGVPHIVAFGPGGSRKRMYEGDRSAASLMAFATG